MKVSLLWDRSSGWWVKKWKCTACNSCVGRMPSPGLIHLPSYSTISLMSCTWLRTGSSSEHTRPDNLLSQWHFSGHLIGNKSEHTLGPKHTWFALSLCFTPYLITHTCTHTQFLNIWFYHDLLPDFFLTVHWNCNTGYEFAVQLSDDFLLSDICFNCIL